MSILLITSDKVFQAFLVNFLLTCGVELSAVASSTGEALVKASLFSYDAILLDHDLQGMDWLQLAEELRMKRPESKIILLIEDIKEQLSSYPENAFPEFTVILKSAIPELLPELLSKAI